MRNAKKVRTMKKINYIVAFIGLAALLMASCNKYEYKYTYDGENYVQLIEPSGTYFVLEGDSVTYEVQFQLIGDAASEDITLPVTFLDTAIIDGVKVPSTIIPGEKGVTALGTSVTISAGEFTGTFSLQGTYDSLEFGQIDTIFLQIADGSAKADSYNNVFLLKIQKYYPYLQEEYPGNYSGTYWGAIMGAEIPASPGLTIVAGEDYYSLVIATGFYQEQIDAWGETWTDGPYPITIHMNDLDATNFVVELPEVQYIGTTNDEWDYWAQPYPVPGSFNAASKELQIVFYVSVYGGDQAPQDIGEYNVMLNEETVAYIMDNLSRSKNPLVLK
jgi:hypothetical protein